MAKLFLLIFVWGPALLGFSLGWLVVHPDDWTGPAVLAPLSAAVTVATYRWGARKLPTLDEGLRLHMLAGMWASAGVGVMVFGMLVTGLIG